MSYSNNEWTRVWACDCAGACSLLRADATYWDEKETSLYVDFYTSVPRGLRERLKTIWRLIRDRDPELDSLVLYREQVEDMHRYLGDVLERKP